MNYFFIGSAILFSGVTVYNTVRSKIIERESLLWFIISVIALVLGLFPGCIIALAGWLGVEYAPSLLFLVSALILLLMSFRHSLKISEMDQKLRELAQLHAVLQNQVDRLEAGSAGQNQDESHGA